LQITQTKTFDNDINVLDNIIHPIQRSTTIATVTNAQMTVYVCPELVNYDSRRSCYFT